MKGAKSGGGGGEDDEVVPSKLDIRVGKIISVEKVGSYYWMEANLLLVLHTMLMLIPCIFSIQMLIRSTWKR